MSSTVQRTVRKTSKTPFVDDGTEVAVEIDIDLIAHRVAYWASFNRTGKASQYHGLIRAKVVKGSGQPA